MFHGELIVVCAPDTGIWVARWMIAFEVSPKVSPSRTGCGRLTFRLPNILHGESEFIGEFLKAQIRINSDRAAARASVKEGSTRACLSRRTLRLEMALFIFRENAVSMAFANWSMR